MVGNLYEDEDVVFECHISTLYNDGVIFFNVDWNTFVDLLLDCKNYNSNAKIYNKNVKYSIYRTGYVYNKSMSIVYYNINAV